MEVRPYPFHCVNNALLDFCFYLQSITEVDRRVYRLNPSISIPPAATKIHRITDADVQDSPTFADVATDIKEFMTGPDGQCLPLLGYNLTSFDYFFIRWDLAG